MKLEKVFSIHDFRLKFGEGSSPNAYDLVRYGPLSKRPLYGLSNIGVDMYRGILVLCRNEKKNLADMLVKDFKDGYSENRKIFPGLSAVLRKKFEIDVAYFSEYDPNKIFDVFENSGSIRDTFPIIVLPRCAKGDYGSIYYRTKAVFLKHEVPSQIVTEELFQSRDSYRWSLLSIAVQIYAKMGGVPYGLDRSVVSPRSLQPSDTLVAVMGLGISTHPQRRKRGVGFITVYDDQGVWSFMDFEILSIDRKEEMSNGIAKLLERGIEAVVRYGSKKNNVIIIHYSGKEVGSREEKSIINAMQTLSSVGKNVFVHVLKIRDSDIVVGLMDSPHKTREGVATWYPPIGAVFKLKPDVYLMTSTGYFMRGDNKIGSNIHIGLPTAMIISRHREIEINPLNSLDDIDLLSTIFGLMRLNYVDVSHPVSRDPVTVRYSRTIAWIVLRLADIIDPDLELLKLSRLRNTMWFL
ncbi:MAG: Piwi domain-containing protein [Desulfurococcaceae archaeon]